MTAEIKLHTVLSKAEAKSMGELAIAAPIEKVKVYACMAAGVTVDHLMGRNRKREAVMARMIVGNYLRFSNQMTYYSIAEVLEKDHSNIVHYMHNLRNLIDAKDKFTIRCVTNFKDLLRNEPIIYLTNVG